MKSKDKKQGLGHILKKAGYDCAYGGKWHAHAPEMTTGNGFDNIAGFGDLSLVEKCIDYLTAKNEANNHYF